MEDSENVQAVPGGILERGGDVIREMIDDEGDVILRLDDRQFFVSSKVLKLASRYFATMFKSGFREGRALRDSKDTPTIDLVDDDADAMAVLLHTIHFTNEKEQYEDLDVDLLYKIAVLCDKFDCIRALKSDMQRWLEKVTKSTHCVTSLWKIIAIAYLSHLTAVLPEQVSQLVRISTEQDLEDSCPDLDLPSGVLGELVTGSELDLMHVDNRTERLQSSRAKILDDMIREVEMAMTGLKSPTNRLKFMQKLCTRCGSIKPLETKICHTCSSSEFVADHCDGGSQLCDFIGSLEEARAWPLSQQRRISLVDFLGKMKLALPQARHSCLGKFKCPLLKRSQALEERLQDVMQQTASIDLHDKTR